MRAVIVMAFLWGLTNCGGDETVASYGAKEVVWQLVELDGKPFDARATLSFADEGALSGQAPCNRYSGQQSAPYPWFQAEKIAVTRMACPQLAAETAYFEALSAMTLSEVSGETLILSNDAGREMVFEAQK
jgi:heat shock protein HslJ